MMLSEGQMSDFKGAALMLPAMPKARELLADKGYDADWFRAALAERGVAACIPSKSNRKVAIPHDALLYKQRHKIENMFGRLKDWRRIHTRYDRCAHTYFSAICLAAAVLFWLSSMSPEPRRPCGVRRELQQRQPASGQGRRGTVTGRPHRYLYLLSRRRVGCNAGGVGARRLNRLHECAVRPARGVKLPRPPFERQWRTSWACNH